MPGRLLQLSAVEGSSFEGMWASGQPRARPFELERLQLPLAIRVTSREEALICMSFRRRLYLLMLAMAACWLVARECARLELLGSTTTAHRFVRVRYGTCAGPACGSVTRYGCVIRQATPVYQVLFAWGFHSWRVTCPKWTSSSHPSHFLC